MRIRSHGTHYWYSSVVLGVWKLRPLERPGGLLRLLWQRQQAQQPLRHGHGQRRDQGIVVNNASNCGNSKPIILNSFTSQNYDHQNDGTTQQLAGCLRDFRNKPFPVKAKIEYFKNVLTVSTKWTCCFIDIRQWFFFKKKLAGLARFAGPVFYETTKLEKLSHHTLLPYYCQCQHGSF